MSTVMCETKVISKVICKTYTSSMGARRNFPWGNVDTLHILFRLLTMQCKRMLTQPFTLCTPLRNCTMLRQQSQKYAISWQQCFCSFMLLSTQYKTTWLTAISSHCLAALPVKNICVQQMHAAKRLLRNLKWILEDLLSCYFYAI